MIAVAVSVLAGIYLLVPGLLFDKFLSLVVRPKKVARTRLDEIFSGLLVAILPILTVHLVSHILPWFGHHPFSLSSAEELEKWNDYHKIVVALANDAYFAANSDKVWLSVHRAWRHELRFLSWMYLVLLIILITWLVMLKNVWRFYASPRLRTNKLLPSLVKFALGSVSEWHLSFTDFLFDPRLEVQVWTDLVTSEGMYRGRLSSYFVDTQQELTGLMLRKAQRFRKKEFDEAQDRLEKPKSDDFWTDIKGGSEVYFPAGKIGNLNIRYESRVDRQSYDDLEVLLGSLRHALGNAASKLNIETTTPPQKEPPANP